MSRDARRSLIHSRNFAKDSLMSQAVPAYLLTLAELRPRVTWDRERQWLTPRQGVKRNL